MDAFKTFTKQPTRVSRIACGAGVMEMEVIIIQLNPTIMVQESFDVHLTSCTCTGSCPIGPVQEVQWCCEADGGREGAFQG